MSRNDKLRILFGGGSMGDLRQVSSLTRPLIAVSVDSKYAPQRGALISLGSAL